MKNYLISIKIGANLSFQAPLGYRSFQMGSVFAEYDLFKTYYTKSDIYLF